MSTPISAPRAAFPIRLATVDDVPALEVLIPHSVRVLQSPYYSPAQMDAAIGPVFGVDRQLIADGTYFAVEATDGSVIACGGWSRRKALFGSDLHRAADDALLDPSCDAARIRAFFVHPDWARRGIGRQLLDACENALQAAGFRTAELVATLAGIPLYQTYGFKALRHYDVPMAGGLGLPVVSMQKHYPG